jgi:hypothetical protein
MNDCDRSLTETWLIIYKRFLHVFHIFRIQSSIIGKGDEYRDELTWEGLLDPNTGLIIPSYQT